MRWQPRGWRLLPLALAFVLAAQLGRAGAKVEPRILVVGINQHPLTLDPHHHDDMVTWAVLCNFYEGLVSFSADMKIEPALAESWENVDPTHWRFHLRHDVRFHRGELSSSRRCRGELRACAHRPAFGDPSPPSRRDPHDRARRPDRDGGDRRTEADAPQPAGLPPRGRRSGRADWRRSRSRTGPGPTVWCATTTRIGCSRGPGPAGAVCRTSAR